MSDAYGTQFSALALLVGVVVVLVSFRPLYSEARVVGHQERHLAYIKPAPDP